AREVDLRQLSGEVVERFGDGVLVVDDRVESLVGAADPRRRDGEAGDAVRDHGSQHERDHDDDGDERAEPTAPRRGGRGNTVARRRVPVRGWRGAVGGWRGAVGGWRWIGGLGRRWSGGRWWK